jgi:hypothetical protein
MSLGNGCKHSITRDPVEGVAEVCSARDMVRVRRSTCPRCMTSALRPASHTYAQLYKHKIRTSVGA